MSGKQNRSYRFAVAALVLALLAGSAWVLASSAIVAARAEKLAGERPYCVQVSSGENYEPARARRDLSAFRMWGDPGNNHAVLVLGDARRPAFWHWSYLKQNFEPDAYGPPAVYCTPSRHFASRLSTGTVPLPANMEFYLSGRYFSVPRGFRPGVRTVSRNGMSLFAQAPAFAPVRSAKNRADMFDHFVLVTFARDASHLHPAGGVKVEPAGPAYGLEKQYVYWSGSNAPGTDYFARAEDGRIVTAIYCVDSVIGSCLHVFQRNGWTYEFRHSPQELRNWQTLEDNLAARAKSFVRKMDE